MKGSIATLLDLALAEDLDGAGDITSAAFVDPDHRSEGKLNVREPAVIAGLDVAREVFRRVDERVAFEPDVDEGAKVAGGKDVASVRGPTRSILTAERTALNFLQRLSGVATTTAAFCEAVRGLDVAILDTRKTTPGWRLLEKAAVVAGGATNHRVGLFDAVMVKDNHLAAMARDGDLAEMVRHVKAERPECFVQLEADTLEQAATFLRIPGVDAILLDNMSLEDLGEAVRLRRERAPAVLLEASGGVTLETVRSIAETGVDRISVGALTHSVRAVDIGLDLDVAS